ncbi:MAG: flavin reductase family protein, partial [Chloroflexi bacterium]|nr:flavin reductase family protein [Chloroflexota bacterium]
MSKRMLGPTTQLYPMPAVLLAVKTDVGANLMAVAWVGIVAGQPPMLAMEVGARHYTTPFLDKEGECTVNVPSAAMAVGVDYCGSVSGTDDPNKAATCGWTLQPSRLVSAPLVAECPVSFECRVTSKVAAGRGSFYLCEIVETHVDEEVLDERGRPDARLVDPLIFTPDGAYARLGDSLGRAWQIGRA